MNLGRMLPERRGTRDSARSVLISLFKTLQKMRMTLLVKMRNTNCVVCMVIG